MHNVNSEFELYPPMIEWLEQYLRDFYRKRKVKIIVQDTHSIYLDRALQQIGILESFPEIVGLRIQIDVLGVVISSNRIELFFIEAKKTPLVLKDLGQLLIYSKLCNPTKSFLFSSGGLGTLSKVLINLGREDLLDYGTTRALRKIHVAEWDVLRKNINYSSIVPSL